MFDLLKNNKLDIEKAIIEFDKELALKEKPKEKSLSFVNDFLPRDYLDLTFWILARAGLTELGKFDKYLDYFKREIYIASCRKDAKKIVETKLFKGFWDPYPGPMDGYASDAEQYERYQNDNLTVWEMGKGICLYIGYNENIAFRNWKNFLNYCDRIIPKLKLDENAKYIAYLKLTARKIFNKIKNDGPFV